MTQRKKAFGLGTSFETLCETNELSIDYLETLIDTLSICELHEVVDELSDSIDHFITKYQTPSFHSLDELMQASVSTYQLGNPKHQETSSDTLFEGLGDLLSND